MRGRSLILSIVLTGMSVASCGGDDSTTSPPPATVSKILNFRAQLTPAGEPGTLNGNPQGSGTFTATLDTSTNVFTWTSTFAGLTSNINNGHIHGPFTPGDGHHGRCGAQLQSSGHCRRRVLRSERRILGGDDRSGNAQYVAPEHRYRERGLFEKAHHRRADVRQYPHGLERRRRDPRSTCPIHAVITGRRTSGTPTSIGVPL